MVSICIYCILWLVLNVYISFPMAKILRVTGMNRIVKNILGKKRIKSIKKFFIFINLYSNFKREITRE